jgi:hypothetical protein
MPSSAGALEPQTRQKAQTLTLKKTWKELEDAEGPGSYSDQALAFLQAKEYLGPGELVGLFTLSYILLQLVHAIQGTNLKAPKSDRL